MLKSKINTKQRFVVARENGCVSFLHRLGIGGLLLSTLGYRIIVLGEKITQILDF